MRAHDEQVEGKIIAFRAPPELVRAADLAAAEAGCSLSDVARGALLRDLRQHGFLPAPAARTST